MQKGKSTTDLSQELMETANIDTYLSGNQSYFEYQDLTDLLTELYGRKSISKAALARRAGMSEVYLHQVFSGRRRPSRDRLLCLCIGMEATLEETQSLLKQAAYAQLYPKIKRDAIIAHGILHQIPLETINDKLFSENEKALL